MRPYDNLSLDDIPGELWKDIPGWEGRYQASNMGRIKSVYKTPRIRKQHLNKEGYPLITLVKDGIFKAFTVHRIVGTLFVENPNNKPVIDHIDCDRQNDAASNLRWATMLENNNNPITRKKKYGRISPMKGITGANSPLSKPIFSIDLDGNKESFWGVMEAKQKYNFDPGLIKKSLMKNGQKAYKRFWFYL